MNSYNNINLSDLRGEAFAAIAQGSVYLTHEEIVEAGGYIDSRGYHEGRHGFVCEVHYPNGCGASIAKTVVTHPDPIRTKNVDLTEGAAKNLWEIIALCRNSSGKWERNPDFSEDEKLDAIFGDSRGNLTEDEVVAFCNEIRQLS